MLNKLASILSPIALIKDHDDVKSRSEPLTQSAQLGSMKPRTLDQMLQYRAQLTPNAILLWYPSLSTDYVGYTAAQIDRRVEQAAVLYSKQISWRRTSEETPKAIAVLGMADLDYIITMFAIYRLGHTVVALSPRLPLEGYNHLLDILAVHNLIYHTSHSKTKDKISASGRDIQMCPMIEIDYVDLDGHLSHESHEAPQLDMDVEGKHLAVVIHSSGSTGLPKPTKLSHDILLTAASKNMNMKAFSCVPFCHGFGLNSLHRSIYAGQAFFLYNASVPLIGKHVIDTIRNHEVEIFFCVPYALKLLAETEAGIEALQKCRLVWFAGSACPDDLGDMLTARGIRLISDYGLSECGPLMTTMRPEHDHTWKYLRPLPHNKPYLIFEERSKDLYELVCREGMPWNVIPNRADGCYATSDLFAKHPIIEGAYRFVARQDDTIVLNNGEKANPTTVEGKVRQHALITEAVMFGMGQSELGMMLIKSDAAEAMTDEQILDQVWPVIERAQVEMPEHARIVRSMVVMLPAGTEHPRTDKGTIIRKRFYQKFAQEIENAYAERSETEQLDLDEPELQDLIQRKVACTLGLERPEELDIDTDLFGLGVDSLQSTQLRRAFQAQLNLKGKKLPFNVVYENPTVRQLSRIIHSMLQGRNDSCQDSSAKFSEFMERFGGFSSTIALARRCVVLTGATGSLGAHLLAQLLQDNSVYKIYCFVRASSAESALVRVRESLQKRKLLSNLDDLAKDKIVALATRLATPGLGLDASTYGKISTETTTVIHAAWPVNFHMSLASFESDIAGTKNLLDLCLVSSASFSFCSSISTSMNALEGEHIQESVSLNLSSALPMGYAQSKLVAENLCIIAAEQSGIKTYIMRIGQIIGDTEYGIWNTTEAIPLMLETAQTIGAVPDMEDVHRWLPVDIVAKTILEAALSAKAPAGTVLNIVSPTKVHWKSDLLPMLRKAGLAFEERPVSEWLDRLRRSDHDGERNPPIKLLSYFESLYGVQDGGKGRGEHHTWQTQNSVKYSSTFAQGWSLSQDMVCRMVEYFKKEGWSSVLRTSHRK